MRLGHLIGQVVLSLVLGTTLLGAGIALTVHTYGLQDNAEEADVIVVLGGGLRWNGTANAATTRRALHGATLYEAAYASQIICTGGFTAGHRSSEAAACADVLVAAGVPRGAIWLEERSRSTEENAIYTAQIMREQGWSSAVLASDGYHLWRGRILFAAEGIAVFTSPAENTTGQLSLYEHLKSTSREVLALFWQAFTDILDLPFTRVGVVIPG